MRLFSIILIVAACVLLGGCYNNTYIEGCADAQKCMTPGSGMSGVATQPGMLGDPSQVVLSTTYQEVYLTDYTPNGPVVRKAIIPVHVAASAASPVPYPPQTVWIQPGSQQSVTTETTSKVLVSSEPMIPVYPGFAPAQPVNPTLSEPAAFYGPASAPVYSTQTSWF